MSSSDAGLGARLVQGDEEALREVYRRYGGAVYGLAMRVLGNRALAEEVTQDVFVRVWNKADRFDAGRGSLRSYLLAMTHSRAVERVRAEDALRRGQQAAGREPAVAGEQDPAQIVGRAEARNAVQQALRALPDDQRVAIEMAYFEGLSYREVAGALGEPEGTVKYRIRIGMQKMRAALAAVEVSP